MGKYLTEAIFVLIILVLFSFVGAVVPRFSTTNLAQVLLFIIPVVVVTLTGHFLGRGIRSVKGPEAMGLMYVSPFIIGGVLALLAILRIAYSAQLRLGWLGTEWYAQLATIFVVGAPLMLGFLL